MKLNKCRCGAEASLWVSSVDCNNRRCSRLVIGMGDKDAIQMWNLANPTVGNGIINDLRDIASSLRAGTLKARQVQVKNGKVVGTKWVTLKPKKRKGKRGKAT